MSAVCKTIFPSSMGEIKKDKKKRPSARQQTNVSSIPSF
jgi:hypothetical protein